MPVLDLLRGLLLSALAAGAVHASGPKEPLAAFDVSSAQGWADTLAVCDLTYFLASRPDLDADVIYARDQSTDWFRPMLAPYFRPPNLFYDEDVKRAFYRLQRAGLVDRAAAFKARARHERSMLQRFRRRGSAEQAFIRDQAGRCDAVLAEARLAAR